MSKRDIYKYVPWLAVGLAGLKADGKIRERIRREHLDYMSQLKGIARNLNQLTRQATAVGFRKVAPEYERMIGGEY